jgi:AdoMet-dependent heme synthase
MMFRPSFDEGEIPVSITEPTARPAIHSIDFDKQPFILAWELTRACNLACVHCRAEAQLQRDEGELKLERALGVIDQVASFPVPPILVLTGGDPTRRPDIVSLVAYATEQGIRCTVTPAGTPLASPRRLAQLKDAGVARIAVSLDGPSAVEHDDFRKVTGSFKWTMDVIQHVQELGIELQVHTTLCRRTLPYLAEMADLADQIDPAVWAVFCLVPTGRAMATEELNADEYEQVFSWLYDRSQHSSWDLKLTEGYHYRRVLHQRTGMSSVSGLGFSIDTNVIGRAPSAVNAGNGFCFISHTGDICPSGFLPVVTGNVRTDSLVDVYQNHPVFRELRDPDQLRGKCGGCGYRAICGGSRSRAYAHYGDYMATDPACAYTP